MKKVASLVLAAAIPFCVGPQENPRPKIYGIAGVRLTVTNVKAADDFYRKILERAKLCVWCEQYPRSGAFLYFAFNDQYVELDPYSPTNPQRRDMSNLLEEISFYTESVPGMYQYLKAKGYVTTPEPTKNGVSFGVRTVDPEGRLIGFVERPKPEYKRKADEPVMRIIHAGFIVHDSSEERHFYEELGFHLYWKGGMKDTETDWMDMQVPDGTDWIELMLNVPENAAARTRGVMNHFAVGVPDIEQAAYRVQKNGLEAVEEPKIGRDGKWQLNLYDPDGTRVELMEFAPSEKPCCSEYSGPHPKP